MKNRNLFPQFAILFIVLLLAAIPFAVARGTEKSGTYLDYAAPSKTATITNWFGLNTVLTAQLVKNTDYCIYNGREGMSECEAIIKINSNYQFDTKLLDGVTFTKIAGGGIVYDYKEEWYQEIPSSSTILYECITGYTNTTEVNKNVSKEIEEGKGLKEPAYAFPRKEVWGKCEDVKNIVTKIPVEKLGAIKSGEDYYLRISGKLKSGSGVDWVPSMYGGIKITEWAYWLTNYTDVRVITINSTITSAVNNFTLPMNGSLGLYNSDIRCRVEVVGANHNPNDTLLCYENSATDIRCVNGTDNKEMACVSASGPATNRTGGQGPINSEFLQYINFGTDVSNDWSDNGRNLISDYTVDSDAGLFGKAWRLTTGQTAYSDGAVFNPTNNLSFVFLMNISSYPPGAGDPVSPIWMSRLSGEGGNSNMIYYMGAYCAGGAPNQCIRVHLSGATDCDTPSSAFLLNKNYFVAVTIDGTGGSYKEANIWRGTADGTLEIVKTCRMGADGLFATDNTAWIFGGCNTAPCTQDRWTEGSLDEMQIYFKALNNDTVKLLFESLMLNGTSAGPKLPTAGNSPPIITNLTITPTVAYTNDALNCSANYANNEGNKGNVSITWYNGSALYSTQTILDVISGDIVSNQTLTGIQAKGEIWNCTINATVGASDLTGINSTTITISKSHSVVSYAPLNNSNFSNARPTFTYNFTSNLSSNGACSLYVSNILMASGTATTGINSTLTPSTNISDGMYQPWNIDCIADTENSTTEKFLVGIDTIAPTVTISAPMVSTSNKVFDIPFAWTSSGASTCWYSINGAATVAMATSGTDNFAISDGIVSNSNTITAACNDSVNNIGTTSVTFTAFPDFAFCNTTTLTPALNFSIWDETTVSLPVNSTIYGTFVYYFADPNLNMSYTHTATTFSNYTYCILPATAKINMSAIYIVSNSSYATRTYRNAATLTPSSTLTNINIYLLKYIDGITSYFHIVDSNSASLQNVLVLITRIIGGKQTVITSGLSDGVGMIAFILDPDGSYPLTFSKEGYTSVIQTISPAPVTYTVVLAGGGTSSFNLTDTTGAWDGIRMVILPSDVSLANGTNFNITCDVRAFKNNLVMQNLNVSFLNGTNYSTNLATTGGNIIGILVNTANNTKVSAQCSIITADNLTAGQNMIWLIYPAGYGGEFSLLVGLTDIWKFTGLGVNDFTKLLLLFLVLIGITVSITRVAGIYNPEGVIGIVLGVFTLEFAIGKWIGAPFMLISTPVFATVIITGVMLIFWRIQSS